MKIKLKRSNQLVNGEAKQPDIASMEYGELAVNFNSADPCIFVRASDGAGNDEMVRIAGSGTGSVTLVEDGTLSAPEADDYPEGTLWFNSAEEDGNLYVLYDDPAPDAGKKWIQITGAGGSGSNDEEDVYVQLNGDGTAQIITGSGGLKVEGLIEAAGGVNVTGGQVVLPGGGSDTEALQKQEIEALIDASGTADGTYLKLAADAGDQTVQSTGTTTFTGQVVLPGGGSDTEALQKQEIEALIDASDTADGNYLKLAAAAGDQTVASTGSTTFNGSAEFKNTAAVDVPNAWTPAFEVKINSSTDPSIYMDGGGTINAVNFNARPVGATDNTIELNGTDGSATFASYVKSEATSGTFSSLNPGYIVVQQPSGSSNDILFRGRVSAGNEVAEIFQLSSPTASANFFEVT